MEAIEISADANELIHKAAERFCASAAEAIGRHGKFAVALSGGKTPRALYELLARHARYRDAVRWDDTYFFFGDERHVPPHHPDSNYRMAREALFDHAPVPEENIFRIRAELPDADEAACRYQEVMEEFFSSSCERGDGFPVFDLILLGTGLDGHTASLFPDSDALIERERWIVANWVKKLASRRITLTYPVLNHSLEVMVLVSGREKAPIIKKIFDRPNAGLGYPIQFVVPNNGRKRWLMDKDASSLVEQPFALPVEAAQR